VIYEDPRFTRDVDVVLVSARVGDPSTGRHFRHRGFLPSPEETLAAEALRPEGGHFNVIHRYTARRAEVYLAGEVPLHRWALDRVLRLPLGGEPISVAPIEYVIIRKLQYFRDSGSDRHLRDISMMLRLSGDTVDGPALDEWCRRLELTTWLERAEGFDPHR